ncbi:kinase-like protein [Eremomyces bilateralis CBS 781.70]|uniref:Kinase-like protein n=1 Tax=Eremomyces bilateralis CBS 781.70 TaxID=1392243 RepID=A0A6G1GCF9_9PEZI|nr:kinase-like protein [Eremomyces bilateralis CBS 781.70]KAF1815775.1 kinase-like protein [Eremomyces bilateralis CBS 781.70]
MASTEAKNRFQKLKLRTTSSRSPAHSTHSLLSALGRESQPSSGNSTPGSERANLTHRDSLSHDALNQKDGTTDGRDGSNRPPLVVESWGSHAPDTDAEASKRFASQDDLERETHRRDDGTYPDGVHSAPQMRGQAIRFDSQVRLENGNTASMNSLRPHGLETFEEESTHPSREYGIDIPHDETSLGSSITPRPQQENGGAANPFGRPGFRSQNRSAGRRRPQYPYRPDTGATTDDLESIDAVASLTSAETASPHLSEARTPVEPPTDLYLSAGPTSPQAINNSPLEFSPRAPFPWPSRSSVSNSRRSRANQYDCDPHTGASGLSSMAGSQPFSRRTSRRSSTRSSASPALNYLAKWSMAEAPRAPAPDDEGQEIGQHSEYIIGRTIGSGGFSVVKEVYTIEAGVQVRRAVKIVKKFVEAKSEAENERLQAEFDHEISIWRYLKHPNILPLVEAWDTPFATFCITELLDGGTLFDLVRRYRKASSSNLGPASQPPHNPYAGYGAKKATASTTSPLSPNTFPPSHPLSTATPSTTTTTTLPKSHGLPPHLARRYIHQLALSLRYLHEDVRVVHRDVKLENCLLDFASRPTDSHSSHPGPIDPSPSSVSAPAQVPSIAKAQTVAARVLLCDFGMADYITSEARPESRGVSPARFDGGGSCNGGGCGEGAAKAGAGGRPALNPRNIGPALPSTLMTPPTHPTNPAPRERTEKPSDHHSGNGFFPASASASLPPPPTVQPPAPTHSNTFIGSLPYSAPELISATRVLYSPAVDVWALGVCAYAIVTGELPFAHPVEGVLAGLVEEGVWDRGKMGESVRDWEGEGKGAGEEAMGLISGCLERDVERRWDIGRVVASPWFEGL